MQVKLFSILNAIQFQTISFQATFMFITRVWGERIKEFLSGYKSKNNGHEIDYIFISSAIWDLSRYAMVPNHNENPFQRDNSINRWGPGGPKAFAKNLDLLLHQLSLSCPNAKVVIAW